MTLIYTFAAVAYLLCICASDNESNTETHFAILPMNKANDYFVNRL